MYLWHCTNTVYIALLSLSGIKLGKFHCGATIKWTTMFSEESLLVAVGLKLKLWNQFWGRLGFSGGTVADNKDLVLKTLKRLKKTGSPDISKHIWSYQTGCYMDTLVEYFGGHLKVFTHNQHLLMLILQACQRRIVCSCVFFFSWGSLEISWFYSRASLFGKCVDRPKWIIINRP